MLKKTEFEKSFKGLATKEDLSTLQKIVFAGFFVMVVAVTTLIINYFSASQTAYQNLVNQVTSQSTKIDLLYQQCTNNFKKNKIQ